MERINENVIELTEEEYDDFVGRVGGNRLLSRMGLDEFVNLTINHWDSIGRIMDEFGNFFSRDEVRFMKNSDISSYVIEVI